MVSERISGKKTMLKGIAEALCHSIEEVKDGSPRHARAVSLGSN